MRKQLLLILMIAIVANTMGQTSSRSLYAAQKMLNTKSKDYNPAEAFKIISEHANNNDSKAMNSLGLLYKSGIGVQSNSRLALKWFEKAAKSGNSQAWHNIALIHKESKGVPQNFGKAVDAFKRGMKLNNPESFYGYGYMLYKGLGVKQNYSEAYKYFKKGAAKRELGSMYMLGICNRNGFGVPVNVDSARYWLQKSAKAGYKRATEELQNPVPEKNNVEMQYSSERFKSLQLEDGYKPVSHHVSVDLVSGEYKGHVIKYDWSGKYVIDQQELRLSIENKNSVLSGLWQEKNQIPVAYKGYLTDSALIFENTLADYYDRYNLTTPNKLEFRNAKIKTASQGDSTFILGNLNLYSSSSSEPEKPVFVMLLKTENKFGKSPVAAGEAVIDSLGFLAHPNPFSELLNLTFTLQAQASTKIVVTNALTGGIVYQGNHETLNKGEHHKQIRFNSLPGTYVVNLYYGNKMKSSLVVKN